jgi:hypothetical protein
VFTSASQSQSSAVNHLQTKRPEPVGLQMSDKQLTAFNKVDKWFHTRAHSVIFCARSPYRFAFFRWRRGAKKRAMEFVKRVGNTVGTNVKGIPLSKATEWEVQAILGESRTCVLSCVRPG